MNNKGQKKSFFKLLFLSMIPRIGRIIRGLNKIEFREYHGYADSLNSDRKWWQPYHPSDISSSHNIGCDYNPSTGLRMGSSSMDIGGNSFGSSGSSYHDNYRPYDDHY